VASFRIFLPPGQRCNGTSGLRACGRNVPRGRIGATPIFGRAFRVAAAIVTLGVHGLHNWWYRCLHRAGIVAEGTTSGERMHKARHTAGQRLLDATGNLKAVQKLLGHESIQTTGDIYTDWDVEQLAESPMEAVQDD